MNGDLITLLELLTLSALFAVYLRQCMSSTSKRTAATIEIRQISRDSDSR